MAPLAIITGGTGGLGKAVTRHFLDEGFDVVVTYYSDGEIKDLLEFVGDKKSQLDAIRVNATEEASVDELAHRISLRKQPIDSVICLIGGFAPGTIGEEIGQTFDTMMALNAKSFLLTCSALIPLMKPTKKDKPGTYRHIVAVTARPALEPTKGIGVYAASKAAVASLVGTLAKELLPDRITVNAIAPSTIDTVANRKAMPKADFKTWVKPEQIARVIFYLSSPASNPTSGAIIPVYGQA